MPVRVLAIPLVIHLPACGLSKQQIMAQALGSLYSCERLRRGFWLLSSDWQTLVAEASGEQTKDGKELWISFCNSSYKKILKNERENSCPNRYFQKDFLAALFLIAKGVNKLNAPHWGGYVKCHTEVQWGVGVRSARNRNLGAPGLVTDKRGTDAKGQG